MFCFKFIAYAGKDGTYTFHFTHPYKTQEKSVSGEYATTGYGRHPA
jgi:hypothetical protein